MHGHEDAIDSRERKPEVDLAERLMETASEHFWEPEKQGGENRKRSGHSHHQMKVAGNKVVAHRNGGQIGAAEKKSRDAARQEKRNKSENKEHRGVELNFAFPERAEPTQQEDASRQSQRRCEHRKDKRRPGIQAVRKHVLTPYAKAKNSHGAKSEDRGAFRPDGLARERSEQMRHDSEAREHRDINFSLCEKPEQPLPQVKQGRLRDGDRLLCEKSQRREKLRAKEAVREEKNTCSEKNAENQHAENGVDKPGPDGERHARQRQALRAQVDRSDG